MIKMLRFLILLVLPISCLAASCPEVKSSPNFDPKSVVGKWEILLHTNASEEARGCCRCVKSTYTEEDGVITAARSGIAKDGKILKATTGLKPVSESLYTHYMKVNEDWVETGSKVAVYSEEADCLGFFACQPIEENLLNNAVFMCRANDVEKSEGFKTWLKNNGVNFDRFIQIDHTECKGDP